MASGYTPAPRLPAELLAHARLLPDRDAILPLLPTGGVIAEIGVALGDFSQKLLEICTPSHFIAVDLFDAHTHPLFWDRDPIELFGGLTHAAFYRRRFAQPIAAGRMRVMEGDSAGQLELLEDASVDIFYVDADHSLAGVTRDLEVIRRKIRTAGVIVMNDYIMRDLGGEYGVIHATNAFMIAERWEMVYFALEPNMFCDVALRKLNTAG